LKALGPVLCVVAARPNFMKMAPLLRAMAAHVPPIPMLLVHTGQHYDKDMSEQLFLDLDMQKPFVNLAVGSGSHAVQTAQVMQRFEPIVDDCKPSCVLVVGDVNSTLACALVAVKKGIPVVHVEAGLRSHDRTMPEEINRIVTDQLSDRLYTTERSAADALAREGVDLNRIFFVGNVMIDSLNFSLKRAPAATQILKDAKVDLLAQEACRGYGVVTLHRPDNVDQLDTLRHLLDVLDEVGAMLPLVFTIHPRTRHQLEVAGLLASINPAHIVLLPPQSYLNMLGLVRSATVVLTDSGGLQEETTALGVPCLTLRENTERPITVTQGTNTLVGRNRELILKEIHTLLAGHGKAGRVPELWDGQAAPRLVADLYTWLHKV
jgi:UDP-N-acetylglucosamine 2-epimerase (non-hydrolysing)